LHVVAPARYNFSDGHAQRLLRGAPGAGGRAGGGQGGRRARPGGAARARARPRRRPGRRAGRAHAAGGAVPLPAPHASLTGALPHVRCLSSLLFVVFTVSTCPANSWRLSREAEIGAHYVPVVCCALRRPQQVALHRRCSAAAGCLSSRLRASPGRSPGCAGARAGGAGPAAGELPRARRAGARARRARPPPRAFLLAGARRPRRTHEPHNAATP